MEKSAENRLRNKILRDIRELRSFIQFQSTETTFTPDEWFEIADSLSTLADFAAMFSN